MKNTLSDAPRLLSLDIMRGIAATGVMVSHCLIMNVGVLKDESTSSGVFSFRHLFLSAISRAYDVGHAAVILFFVLSGFVLSYSLLEHPTSYAGFVIKRLFRIYPVFLFIILYSFALHHLVVTYDVPSLASVRYLLSHTNPSFIALGKHLLMFGNEANNVLDPPMWSIVHEMRISLVFPLLLLGLEKYHWHCLAGCLLLSFFCSILTLYKTGMIATGIGDTTVFASFLSTGYFMAFFACGAFFSLKRRKVFAAIARQAPWKKATLLIISLYCLFKTTLDKHMLAGVISDCMSTLGVLGLIALALSIRMEKGEGRNKILHWLGTISYSLYLVHFIVIFILNAANEVMGEKLSFWMLDILIIVFSLLAADLINRTIERPMVAIGKILCRHWGLARVRKLLWIKAKQR